MQVTSAEKKLVTRIKRSESRANYVTTALETDERVIARVTDGIYRQPGSALRELISNAYDADATRVVIKTDAPRFDRITVEDNGRGMTPEVLAHLLLHIGGSAKRDPLGSELKITKANDPSVSPKGRKLIGKIGIGLFSVSQLTQSFQIITKVKGDPHRTIATVQLRQFSDQARKPDEKFESGKVTIWREKAKDRASHGTTIVLSSIRPQARDTLRSRDIWNAITQEGRLQDGNQTIEPPQFHVGAVDENGDLLVKTDGEYDALPWDKGDSGETAFKKLVDAIWTATSGNANLKLENAFDYYLRMVWQLALAVPLPYVYGHLFDEPSTGWAPLFEISNSRKGNATRLRGSRDKTIREAFELTDEALVGEDFQVFFDDLLLSRPIKYRKIPFTQNQLKTPLVFIGKCRETFDGIDDELSGGPLAFEAYLFWAPKIAPVDHQGSLIRIHGASGTLFDPTFMRYQVSELTRLRQITCEIFVSEGLDSALNIDRESFNNAHPHAVFITRWLHSALRQLATAQKKVASEIRDTSRAERREEHVGLIAQIARDVWQKEMDDEGAIPPEVEFLDADEQPPQDVYAFRKSDIFEGGETPSGKRAKARSEVVDAKVKAIIQVLASFDLIDRLSRKRQAALVAAIYKILEVEEKKE